MTRDEFLAWVWRQEGRYEFDGFAPTAMVGNTLAHGLISQNLFAALRGRLRPPCYVLGLDIGVATSADGIRFPDAVISCRPFTPADRIVPEPSIVFEIISPTSGRIDRIIKVKEYAAVSSLRRYVIVESSTIGLTVLGREVGDAPWTATSLAEGDSLSLPELGIEVPIDELYAGVPLADSD